MWGGAGSRSSVHSKPSKEEEEQEEEPEEEEEEEEQQEEEEEEEDDDDNARVPRQLAVPSELFRPISPHSLSDPEGGPRLAPPLRTHAFSRTLRRQVGPGTTPPSAVGHLGGTGDAGSPGS